MGEKGWSIGLRGVTTLLCIFAITAFEDQDIDAAYGPVVYNKCQRYQNQLVSYYPLFNSHGFQRGHCGLNL